MQIRFLEIAEIELDEAVQYYNREAAGPASIALQRNGVRFPAR